MSYIHGKDYRRGSAAIKTVKPLAQMGVTVLGIYLFGTCISVQITLKITEHTFLTDTGINIH